MAMVAWRILMRSLLSNTDATDAFAEKARSTQEKVTNAERASALRNQTKMFIGHLTGHDCVDPLFEKRIGCVRRSTSASDSRGFPCVFVDVYSCSRHS